jgi:hypothetical protein
MHALVRADRHTLPEKLLRTAGESSGSSILSPHFSPKSAETQCKTINRRQAKTKNAGSLNETSKASARTEDGFPPREQLLVGAPPFLAEDAGHEGLANPSMGKTKEISHIARANLTSIAGRRDDPLTFFFLPFLTKSSTEAGLGMSKGAL